MTVNHIALLEQAWRDHLDIAAAISHTLDTIKRDPVTALRLAVVMYDRGHDPDGLQLRAALQAATPADWANEL